MLQELTNKIKKIIPEIKEEMEEQEQITDIAGDFIRQSQRPSGKTNVYERDITLEDVLRCLGKVNKTEKDSPYIDYDYYDNARILFKRDGVVSWQLGKPLHEQSDETIKELNKLI